jgi:aminoglycoside 6'-N-acetyltransferase I
MHMVDLRADDEAAIRQVATLLVEDFATDFPGSWPDLDSALEEVRASFGEARISRVALDEDGAVPDWIGGISQYRGHVWELHPLVADLEERVKERGGLTITLGTDDVFDQTSLSGTTWPTSGISRTIPMSFTRSRAT